MIDVVIKDAAIIDGSGAPAYTGDVGILDGKLCPAANAKRVIDAKGLTLTPGFIDAHSHGDLMINEYSALTKLSQGITTHTAGQCGVSMYPMDASDIERHARFVSGIAPYPTLPKTPPASYDEYCEGLEREGMHLNMATFIGHGALRLAAMGYDTCAPTARQLDRMCGLLKDAVAQGALGLSTGLVYAPNCYAQTDEILALLKAISPMGGMYATHVRNETDGVEQAEEEALYLAKSADIPVFISHFKAGGRQNWGKPARMLRRFDEAIRDGVRLTVDHYPYLAGMTSLNVSIPPQFRKDGPGEMARLLEETANVEEVRRAIAVSGDYDNYIYGCGGFDGVMVSSCPYFHDAEGLTVAEYARRTGQDPCDAYIDLLKRNKGLGLAVYFSMCEEDLCTIAKYEHTVVGTDGLPGKPEENGHPRAFASFPHAICHFVKEKRLMPIEQMIRRMTGLAAERLGYTHKGLIRNGMDADLVLMDYDKLRDTATYTDSNRVTEGILEVFVAGQSAYKNGALTGAKAGRAVRRSM